MLSSFRDVDMFFALAFEMFREVVDQTPVEILVHVSEGVALLRKHEHIESLAGADQCVDHSHRVAWVDIVVDVAMDKEKMSLEVLRDFRVGCDLVDEGGVALRGDGFLDAMVRLAPPAVVDGVVMVAGA